MEKDKKHLLMLTAPNLKTLLRNANKMDILKDDIVQIHESKDSGTYYLIYFGNFGVSTIE